MLSGDVVAVKIGTNIASIRAQRQLGRSTDRLSSVNEKLASGQRINKAADDAAGLAIADSLRADRRVYLQGIRNINDAISYLNIADGALAELSGVSIRQKELANQSANGVLGFAQRSALNEESGALTAEFNRILQTTSFNGRKILSEDGGEVRIQAGYGVEGSVVVSLGSSGTQTVGTGTFAAAVTYASGNSPSLLTTGDLNGDGNLDLIAANRNSGLTVHLGNGNGTFEGAVTYAAGLQTRGVTVGDLNGNGVLDLISTDRGENTLNVYLGNGNGTFAARVSYAAGSGPNAVTTGDFNGDGKLDLIAASLYSNDFTVHLGNGDGTFQARVTYATGSGAFNLASTDLNGDGKLDIVVTNNASNDLTVHLGNGNGTFAARVTYASGNAPRSIAVGDLNGDGKVDLVSSNFGSNDLTVFLGNGNGTFEARVTYAAGSQPQSVTIGDLNGDGKLDLIAANRGSNTITVHLGNGNGTFAERVTYAAGSSPRSVTTGDLNGDGVLDLIAANYNSNNLTVHLAITTTAESPGGIAPAPQLDLTTITGARAALGTIDTTLDNLTSTRATIGAAMSRMETAARTLLTQTENYAAAESRIRDADVAADAAEAVRLNILQQAGAAVLAQANIQPQVALQLLQG